jgi:hypothetical protein
MVGAEGLVRVRSSAERFDRLDICRSGNDAFRSKACERMMSSRLIALRVNSIARGLWIGEWWSRWPGRFSVPIRAFGTPSCSVQKGFAGAGHGARHAP